MERHTVSRLIGAPPDTSVTRKVENRRRQCASLHVVLFDEIEQWIFNLLLILDDSRLTDNQGTVDFTNAIIVMTSNVQSDCREISEDGGDENEIKQAVEQTLRVVSHGTKPD